MKYLKKISLLGVLVLFLLVVAACGASTSGVGRGHGREDLPQINEQTGEPIMSSSGEVGDYKVTIYDDYEIMEYYEDSYIIVVTYDFTNNSDENHTFLISISDKAFQNGIKMKRALLVDLIDKEKFRGASTEIQPGATITIREAYKLRDTTSPVTIEIKEAMTFGKPKITKEFNLQ